MVRAPQGTSLKSTSTQQTLGSYAYEVIKEQYQGLIKQEKKVLADKVPEPLHQMRVATRRLRTALQVFDAAIEFPKEGSVKRLRDLARVLGEVRDLDVQQDSLKQQYCPKLSQREQKQLNKVAAALKEQRKKAFATMKATLEQPLYQELKTTYAKWLKRPQYTSLAELPLPMVLPDLLSPLLSHLLLHPAWLISKQQAKGEQAVILHELRKACKHARYQSEFFIPFYGEEFANWIEEVKALQAQLGDFQDTQVFLELSAHTLGRKPDLPELQALIQQQQDSALDNWNEIRQKYLDSGFRHHLHQILLKSTLTSAKAHPELVEQDTPHSN